MLTFFHILIVVMLFGVTVLQKKKTAKEYVYTVIYGLLFNQHHQHGVLRHRVFRLGPLIHEHSDYGWAHSGDQSLCVGWCVQLFSFRLSQNQLDARSAAWLSFWIAFRFSLPVVPTDVISRQMDCEQNPLTPTSTGNSQVPPPSLSAKVHKLGVFCFLSLIGLSLHLLSPMVLWARWRWASSLS